MIPLQIPKGRPYHSGTLMWHSKQRLREPEPTPEAVAVVDAILLAESAGVIGRLEWRETIGAWCWENTACPYREDLCSE